MRPARSRLLAGELAISSSGTSALEGFVNRLTSRSVLSEEEQCAILSLCGHERRVAAHTDIVRLGEEVDHSCLLVDGLVGRFGQNREGVRQITCLYIPGDVADLPSVVSPKSAWGLSALTTTTILCVPHSDLRRLAAKHPGVGEALWRDCVADGSIFSEWVVNVGRRGAIARISHLFCEMAIRSERAGQGTRHAFALPINQSDLADAAGLTNVHVNRTLRQLRDRSVVTARDGTVTVHDWNQLVSIGEFDDAFMLLDGPYARIAEAA